MMGAYCIPEKLYEEQPRQLSVPCVYPITMFVAVSLAVVLQNLLTGDQIRALQITRDTYYNTPYCSIFYY